LWSPAPTFRSSNFIHYVNFSTFTALPIPGNPGWTGTPGVYNGDTNYSKLYTLAPFYEHIFEFGDHFSLLAGVRADIIYVKVNDPLYGEAAAAGNVNPYAPPGAHASVIDPNFNVSPTFKPWKWLTTYFTYNYSQAYSARNGGGFPAGDGNGHATIPVTNELHVHSDLYEAGAKASILGDTLFINTAFFQQHRIQPGIAATYARDTARGFEIEADYQPAGTFI
jgi:iron complex outermembrane recepter protein